MMKTVLSLLVLLWGTVCFAQVDLPKGIIKLDGKPAPALALKNADGEYWDIKNSRGHWLFVHFWASWCGPCRKEMPTIQAVYKQFDSKQLEIVVVNTAESEDTVFSFLASVNLDINSLLDTDGLVTEKWKPRGLPATFIVDPQGKMQFLALGGRPWDSPDYLNFLKNLSRK